MCVSPLQRLTGRASSTPATRIEASARMDAFLGAEQKNATPYLARENITPRNSTDTGTARATGGREDRGGPHRTALNRRQTPSLSASPQR